MLVDEGALLVAVADGLGGHPAGDVASRLAVEALGGSVSAGEVGRANEPGELLMRAVLDAHQAIVDEVRRDAGLAGMATTVVVATVHDGVAWVVHVGDSRAYLLDEDGRLRRLTRDHGLGGYLTQALGLEGGVSPDVAQAPMPSGSRLLLCTDGLTNMVEDATIGELLGRHQGAQDATDALVEAALEAGGIDNVTVIVVDA